MFQFSVLYVLTELSILASQTPKLLDQVRQALRVQHYAIRTEEAYVHWMKRFILSHHKRHPREMGCPEIEAFLIHLAVEQHVAAATQNQTCSATLSLYRYVLELPVDVLEAVRAARTPRRLPAVFTRAEVRAMLKHLHGARAC